MILKSCKSEQSLIPTEFHGLLSHQKKMVIRDLSQSERKSFLKIIAGSHSAVSKKCKDSIIKKILKVKKVPPPITRSDKRRTRIRMMEKKLKYLFHLLRKAVGFVTEKKVARTVCQILGKEPLKVEKKNLITNKKQLKKLVKQYKTERKKGYKGSFGAFLKINGLPTQIGKITFSEFLFKGMNLDGVTFQKCSFQSTNFSRLDLRNIKFIDCDFENVAFVKTTMKGCEFVGCSLQEVMFVGARLGNVKFIDSSVRAGSFEDSSLEEVVFDAVEMPGTHFLQADIKSSNIYNSNLSDVIFFDSLLFFQVDAASKKTAKVSRPVVAIVVTPETTGITLPKAYRKLDISGGMIPIRVTDIPTHVDQNKINEEVQHILDGELVGDREVDQNKINEEVQHILDGEFVGDREEAFSLDLLEEAVAEDLGVTSKKMPVPQQILTTAKDLPSEHTAINQVLKKAHLLAAHTDALFLPGGDDLPPGLYGAKEAEETSWSGDYRRSIFEMAMIREAHEKGVPLMGICRGFQMINVYFGARLEQHVPGHKGIQTFQFLPDPEGSFYNGKGFSGSFASLVFHHQGIADEPRKQAQEHLKVVTVKKGLVKAVEPKEGATSPIIGIQFHPEFYDTPTASSLKREVIDRVITARMSGRNELFWKAFGDSARTYRKKRDVNQAIRALSFHKAAFATVRG